MTLLHPTEPNESLTPPQIFSSMLLMLVKLINDDRRKTIILSYQRGSEVCRGSEYCKIQPLVASHERA